MVSMDRQIAQCLADYIIANPRDAAALIDACSRITEVHADGTPVRKAVSPSDFSGREWCALVDVANLLSFFVVPKPVLFQPDWRRVFEPEAIAESVRHITNPEG